MSISVDDIKSQYSMADVAARYGLRPNRAGFIQCPFHQGDRTPSLKLYKNDFHCYGCGAHGDIFTFVMLMDNCDFKTAFRQLGGEYSGNGLSDAAILRIKRLQLEKQKRERILRQARDQYSAALEEMNIVKEQIKKMEPMSDEWCAAQNRLVVLEANADSALNEFLNLQKQEKR